MQYRYDRRCFWPFRNGSVTERRQIGVEMEKGKPMTARTTGTTAPSRQQRILRAGFILMPVSIPLGAIGVPLFEVLSVTAQVAFVVLALIFVRRLPRLVISGALGGGLVGLFVLGGGLRLAMRIVALLGARREVTVGGTLFLLVGGAMAGAILGISIAAAHRAWDAPGRVPGLVIGFALYGMMLLSPEAFEELLHDGAGGWVNFPLFLIPILGYGLAANWLIRRIERRLPRWTVRLPRRRAVKPEHHAAAS